MAASTETSRTNRQSLTSSVNIAGPNARENRSDSCPAALVDWVEDDLKNSFFGGAITYSQVSDLQKKCVDVMKTNQALIQSKQGQTSIENGRDFTKALSEKYKGVAPATAVTLDQCNKLTGGKDEIIKARYFSSMAKMESANSALIDEISYYDGLLDGEKKSNTLNCNPAFPFPEVSKKCAAHRGKNNTQACADSKKDRVDYLTTKTLNALDEIEKQREALKKCMDEKGYEYSETPGVNPEFSTGPTRTATGACKGIEIAIALTQSEVPWVKGKAFETYVKRVQQLKKMGRTEAQIRDVFKQDMLDQIEKTRDEMAKAYEKNISMSECLTFSSSRGTAKCDVSEIKDHMAGLPPLNNANTHSSRKVDLEISTRQDADQCISDAAQIRTDFNKQVREDSFKYLSYFSMGLGPIGFFTVRGAGMLSGISSAMTARRIQGISRGLMTASSSLAIGVGTSESIEACQKAGEVSIAENAKNSSVRAPACAAVPSIELESITSEYNECIKSALLTTVELLPFTLGLLKQTNKDLLKLFKDPKQRAEVEQILLKNGRMSDEERKQAAETLLGRKLSESQKDCILAAHMIADDKYMKVDTSSTGSSYLEPTDLKAKNKHLISACNLPITDAFLLTRAGITGNAMSMNEIIRRTAKITTGKEYGPEVYKAIENSVQTGNFNDLTSKLRALGITDQRELNQLVTGGKFTPDELLTRGRLESDGPLKSTPPANNTSAAKPPPPKPSTPLELAAKREADAKKLFDEAKARGEVAGIADGNKGVAQNYSRDPLYLRGKSNPPTTGIQANLDAEKEVKAMIRSAGVRTNDELLTKLTDQTLTEFKRQRALLVDLEKNLASATTPAQIEAAQAAVARRSQFVEAERKKCAGIMNLFSAAKKPEYFNFHREKLIRDGCLDP